ncbi:phenoloxidase-activating enzyme-like [Anticarsia gemmatalis]|uniref:phenoloxidase-activating enzyme-like n=1 Tax=Anticarsia gemmatalis TaxID=129554 RepID=UPI003F76B636
MYYIKVLGIFVALCCVVNGQQGPCPTPSGGQGECKSIYSCQPLLAVLNKKDRTQQDMDLLKRSHCGFDGNAPAVCCPSQVEPPPPEKPSCFTPEGKQGKCIGLYSCPAIANLLQPPVPNDKILFVQNSRCDGPDQYSVCCGPVPEFKQRTGCAATVSAFPPDHNSECCGTDSVVGNKIHGGTETAVDQYPWLVLIEYTKDGGPIKTLCGGALISGKYVLTAGHCVAGAVLSFGIPRSVRLGEYDTSNEGPDCVIVEADGEDCTEGITRIPIERTIPHPEYNPVSPLKRHDIALIRMKQMAPYTDFIRPICLPIADITLRNLPFNVTAAGWGAVSAKQSSSAKKLHVDLPFVRQTDCQRSYTVPGRSVQLWKGQICAGGEKGKDSCKGDSGGPLMYQNGKIYEATGVVSFGPTPCGIQDVPGVYTNVFEYNSWIRSNIAP